MCKGKPLCSNKNDLKWCKDVRELPSPNFKHFIEYPEREHSKCNKSHEDENTIPNGQDILAEDIGNGLVYNCFNRADEDPFKGIFHNQSWSDWVKIPCHPSWFRRCLGQKPSQPCVTYTMGTF